MSTFGTTVRAVAREAIADVVVTVATLSQVAVVAAAGVAIWVVWAGEPPAFVAAWLAWQWP